MRTQKSFLNMIVGVIGQGLGIILSFVIRIFFSRFLGATYLGLNGLFSNILSVMSLVELGIGSAIIFSLYKPLAEDDKGQIKALMSLYRKFYSFVGVFIFTAGLMMSPFLEFFIKDMPDIEHISFIFMLYVANAALSYFNAYKQNLIIADQKKYITVIYHYVLYFILGTGQVAALYLTKNIYVYLILQILFTVLENFVLTIKANQLYPFLKEKSSELLNEGTKAQIYKNTKALFMHRIGGIVVTATDNLVISKFISLILVGCYANYSLVINSLRSLINQMFMAITSSVGNLNVDSTVEKKEEVFNVLFYINYVVYGICSICLFVLFNDFVGIAFGKKLLLETNVVFWIVLNFYLSGMRQALLTFKDAMGMYWQDRYRPIFEAIINLGSSLFLLKFWGISGVFMGTALSTVVTCLWLEPYIVYRDGFGKNVVPFFKKYFTYLMLEIFSGGIVVGIASQIVVDNWGILILKGVIILGVTTILILGALLKTKESQYVIKTARNILKK